MEGQICPRLVIKTSRPRYKVKLFNLRHNLFLSISFSFTMHTLCSAWWLVCKKLTITNAIYHKLFDFIAKKLVESYYKLASILIFAKGDEIIKPKSLVKTFQTRSTRKRKTKNREVGGVRAISLCYWFILIHCTWT